jgi:hypothetical protein
VHFSETIRQLNVEQPLKKISNKEEIRKQDIFTRNACNVRNYGFS